MKNHLLLLGISVALCLGTISSLPAEEADKTVAKRSCESGCYSGGCNECNNCYSSCSENCVSYSCRRRCTDDCESQVCSRSCQPREESPEARDIKVEIANSTQESFTNLTTMININNILNNTNIIKAPVTINTTNINNITLAAAEESSESPPEQCCFIWHPKQCFSTPDGGKKCTQTRTKECGDICSRNGTQNAQDGQQVLEEAEESHHWPEPVYLMPLPPLPPRPMPMPIPPPYFFPQPVPMPRPQYIPELQYLPSPQFLPEPQIIQNPEIQQIPMQNNYVALPSPRTSCTSLTNWLPCNAYGGQGALGCPMPSGCRRNF